MAQPWYDYNITNGYSTTAIPGNWDSPHYAVDVATPYHTEITNLLAGTVERADYQPWGGEVFVQLANGLQEYFYHLDDIAVQVGQKIGVGADIGLSGGQNTGGAHPVSTEYSSGPHTHFGLFTGQYVSGPAGQQPYGPDPTSIITSARNGTLTGIGTGGGSTDSGTCPPLADWQKTLCNTPGVDTATCTAFFCVGSETSTNVSNTVGGIGADLQGVNTLATALTSPDLWVRVGLVVVGVIVVILGLYAFVKDM